MLRERPQAMAHRVAGRLVPSGGQQQQEHDVAQRIERLSVDLGIGEHADEAGVVAVTPGEDLLPHRQEQLREPQRGVELRTGSGVVLRVGGGDGLVAPPQQVSMTASVDTEEVADHLHRQRHRDLLGEVERRTVEVGVEQRGDELSHGRLERTDRLRGEVAVEDLAIDRVLGRVEGEQLLRLVAARRESDRVERLVELRLLLVAGTEAGDPAIVLV